MEVAIIMGAGPAGLTAAYELLINTDIKPIIIETDADVGGLSKTINYKGNLIDIGGHRFFSKSKKIIDWWLKFLPLEQTNDSTDIKISYQNKSADFKIVNSDSINTTKGLMMIRPRKSRIFYQQHFFDYPLQLNKKTFKNLGLKKIFKIGVSYIYARLFPVRPQQNLAQFFRNRFGKELYETFFKDYTEKVWGVPCEAIPSNWGYQRIKDLDIGKIILHAIKSIFFINKKITQKGTSTSLIEQFLYPQKGPGQMWKAVADKIIELGGEIRVSTKVTSIKAGNEKKIEAVICTNINSGEKYALTGDYFFSTIPVKELINNLENINIEPVVSDIAKGLCYRDFIIVGILLRKLFINDENKNTIPLTDNWIYLQDKGIKAGRVQFFNNWSKQMVQNGDDIWIGVEYFCNDNDEFWNKNDATIRQMAISEMQQIGLINEQDVLDTTVIKIPKAYPSYTGTYDNFEILQKFLNGFENLFAIGRNGMHRYNNSDHSMMTAIVAVENIIQGRKDKDNIWSVNLEDDYHEED